MQKVQKLIKEAQAKFDYDLREYTVEELLKKLSTGQYKLGATDNLSDWQKSIFVESMLLNLPVSQMASVRVLAENGYSYHYQMVTNSELLHIMQQFINNEFALINLEELSFLNGRKFDDLPTLSQRNLLKKQIRVTEYLFLQPTDNKRLRNRLLLNTCFMRKPKG